MTAPEAALCPRCGHAQTEASGAVSTYCKACGQHFLLQGTPRKRAVRMPRKNRIVTCFHCGEENKVTTAALSTQCLYCSGYLDLSDHRIEGASSEKLQTYGSIAFMPGSHHASLQVYAHTVTVSGLVDAKLWAESQIEFKDEGRVRGTAQAAKVVVARAAQAVANDVHAEDLEVRGQMQARHVYVTGELHVHPQGSLRADRIFASAVRVNPGGELTGDLETALGPEARVLPSFYEKKARAKAVSNSGE